ncbi:MAG: PQQ-binding-like beta-propeller repeat protein [Magnetovibrio sp.]|nr:PQQ-binding-like beta-propeller repeat protein [Magnetovibrio sp.]
MSRLSHTFSTLMFALMVLMLGPNAQAALNKSDNPGDSDNDSLKLAWTFDTGKPFNIVPTLGSGKIFVTPVHGPLYALNAKTGHLDWTYDPKEGLWDRGLTADGDQIFVCYKGGKFAALNVSDGAVQWKADLGIDCLRPHYVSGDTVYVSTTFVGPGLKGDPLTGAKLFAIDRNNGHVKWDFKTKNFLLQTANSRDGVIYLGGNYFDPDFAEEDGGPARYYALDQATGKMKWVHENIDGTPKVLVPTENLLLFSAYQDFIQALDVHTGKRVWKRDTNNWIPGFVSDGKDLYFGSATTIVHSWPIDDPNKENWRFNIPGRKFDYLLIRPVIEGDRLYFMSQRGFVYALDRKTGKRIFRYGTGMNARVGISFADGYIYMNDSKGRVYGYKVLK